MAHTCKQMERSREIQTVIGQQAYIAYKHWLEKRRYKPPPIETFPSSTYYTSFIKFVKYCKETGVSDIELYIDLMVDRGISPAIWTRSESYDMYIERLDKSSDPLDQAETTLETLAVLAERLDVKLVNVFNELRYGEVLELIHQRKLSPWILLCSSKFKQWHSKLDPSEKEILMRSINVGYWSVTLEKRPDLVRTMKELVVGAGL